MTIQSSAKVVSANDALDGDVVYLTSCDAWTPDIKVAELLDLEDHDWRLAFAQRLREVKNAALVDAREDVNGLPELVAA